MLGEGQRLFVHLRLFIRVDEVPIDIFDLSDRRHYLIFECDVRNLFVVSGDPQISQVGTQAEPGEQLLLKCESIHRTQRRRQVKEWAVSSLPIVVELESDTRSCREGLAKSEIRLAGVELQQRDSVDLLVRKRAGLMFSTDRPRNKRIV